MPNPCTAVDANGSALNVGDTITITAKVVGDAGGQGMIYIRFIDPTTSAVRTGGQQSDVLPCFDANLCTKV